MNARPSGSGRVSLSEVARESGVSASIASRILGGVPSVRARQETRDRVKRVAKRLGYQPHGAARALRLSRNRAVGLVVHDITNPIHAEIIHGAQAVLTKHGNAMLLADAEQLAQNDAAFAELLGPGRVDGLLWHGSGEAYDSAMITRAAAAIPTLLINSSSRVGVPAIHLDDGTAAEIAVEHLVSLGHRRIGFIGGSAGSDLTERREQGFRDALAAHRLPVDGSQLVRVGWEPADGAKGLARILAESRPPTAVLVANVVIGSGALSAARERGLTVPTDLSMIAIHDSWFVDLASPAMTTVRLPLRQLGEEAVNRMLASTGRIEPGAEDRASTTVIREPAPELIVRETTAPAKDGK